MHPSQGTAHNPSQGTAQGRQAVGSWRRQGPDQPPLGVHHQHSQRKHDSAAPSKIALVQAWGCPASPPMADNESYCEALLMYGSFPGLTPHWHK